MVSHWVLPANLLALERREDCHSHFTEKGLGRSKDPVTPDFVTFKLQGRDVDPDLSDLESWVCPTWSQLPLKVQKLQASLHIKSPSLLHSIATLPALLWGALSQGLPLSQLQQGWSQLCWQATDSPPMFLFMPFSVLENLAVSPVPPSPWCCHTTSTAQMVRNLPAIQETPERRVWSLFLGRSPGGGHGNPL